MPLVISIETELTILAVIAPDTYRSERPDAPAETKDSLAWTYAAHIKYESR